MVRTVQRPNPGGPEEIAPGLDRGDGSVTPDEVRGLLCSGESRRSKQRNIGPSEIGGCRRRVWHRLHGTTVTNPSTLRLAANLGTAIHSWIEATLTANDRFLLETSVERDGIRGTVDCFDLERNEVVDWKTVKLSGIPYFPDQQKRWQVQVYGWLMSQDRRVDSVCLVGIPRDGTERDIVTHVEPYDEGVAREALAWLDDVRGRVDAPRPERKAKQFCRPYCPYFDASGVVGCPGLPR